MPRAGDVVIVDFVGATGVKRRPTFIVSTDAYHAHRPDIVVCLLTSQVSAATAPTDYPLQDWAAAGLHVPSVFRVYIGMALAAGAQAIGRLSRLARGASAPEDRPGVLLKRCEGECPMMATTNGGVVKEGCVVIVGRPE
jgi:mRNA interferase MazF